MGELRTEVIKVTTAGSAGSATGNSTSGAINGWIENIYIDYHDDAPDTTVVTTAFAIRGGAIHAAGASKTDKMFTPRDPAVNGSDTAIAYSGARFAVNQAVKVTVTLSDALTDCATVYITYEAA